MQNIIIGMFDSIHNFLINSLPAMGGGYTQNITDSITWMVNLIGTSDFLIPTTTLFAVFAIVIGIRLTMFAVFIVNWVLRFIP